MKAVTCNEKKEIQAAQVRGAATAWTVFCHHRDCVDCAVELPVSPICHPLFCNNLHASTAAHATASYTTEPEGLCFAQQAPYKTACAVA